MNSLKNPFLFLIVGIVVLTMTMSPIVASEAGDPSADTAAAPAKDPAPSATEPTGDKADATEEEADAPPSLAENSYAIDNMILFIAAVLVLFMQAGFAMLESGLNAAKNTINILSKNLLDLSIGVLLFFVVGYALMYPGDYSGKTAVVANVVEFGAAGIPSGAEIKPEAGKLHPQVAFLFQVAFCATAATIVSGAVAGRMKFHGYLIYTAVLTAIIYPISGFWQWGGGWLSQLGFHDFAGSLVVHAVGGFAGLAGAIVLGARIGRFSNGKSNAMPGHNIAIASLGVFILWIGWYGFNPGSQLAFTGDANTVATVTIATNTTLAAAAGTLLALVTAWVIFKKPDLTMALNGALAGLVGITANCDCVTNLGAIAIGAVAGMLVVAGILLLDKLKIDDPVGAFPVHGLCGIWGGIGAAAFGGKAWGAQLIGSLAIPLWAFGTMFVVFYVMKLLGVLRVSAEEERAGLDISHHGMHAYPPNQVQDFMPTPVPAQMSAPAGATPSLEPRDRV